MQQFARQNDLLHLCGLPHSWLSALTAVELYSRVSSFNAEWGIRILLCEWLRASHPGVTQDTSACALHRHRHPSRGWSGGEDPCSFPVIALRVKTILSINTVVGGRWSRWSGGYSTCMNSILYQSTASSRTTCVPSRRKHTNSLTPLPTNACRHNVSLWKKFIPLWTQVYIHKL